MDVLMLADLRPDSNLPEVKSWKRSPFYLVLNC